MKLENNLLPSPTQEQNWGKNITSNLKFLSKLHTYGHSFHSCRNSWNHWLIMHVIHLISFFFLWQLCAGFIYSGPYFNICLKRIKLLLLLRLFNTLVTQSNPKWILITHLRIFHGDMEISRCYQTYSFSATTWTVLSGVSSLQKWPMVSAEWWKFLVKGWMFLQDFSSSIVWDYNILVFHHYFFFLEMLWKRAVQLHHCNLFTCCQSPISPEVSNGTQCSVSILIYIYMYFRPLKTTLSKVSLITNR